MEAEAKRFHDLPLDVKMSVSVTRDQKGYAPARAAITTQSEFHDSRKLDTVECFVVATDYPDDNPHVQAGDQFYGKMPWLPEEVLEVGAGTARVREDFDTAELTVVPGEIVEARAEREGWVWCRADSGAEGWVPLKVLEPL